MKAQLYLYDLLREKFQRPKGLFADTYSNKIKPLFSNIEEESKEIAKERYCEMGKHYNPDYHDKADFAETAWEAGLEHYEGMALMKYNTKLMWISTLYQFSEKQTGANTNRRDELKRAFEMLRQDDIFVCTKIDRLARSIIDLNNLIKELNNKCISVHFIKDNLQFDVDSTNNSLQTLLFNILGSFAQFERDLIVERTTEGRLRAKKQGKHMGRPSQPKKTIERAVNLYINRETNGMSVNDIVKLTGVPRSTLYQKVK